MRRLLYTFLFLLALAGIYHFVFKPPFNLQMMVVGCNDGMDCWEGKPLTEEEQLSLNTLLGQPFTYLNKGNQSYVFKSADGQHVLKFFHFERMRPSALWQYLETIPFIENYTDKHRESCDKRFRRATTGYAVAYRYDRDNCGLLFMRLGCLPHIPHSVTLVDSWGTSYTIDMDKTYFVIQKLATPANDRFSALLDKGNTVKVKKLIDKIFALYLDEYHHGVYDFDHNLMHNVGFEGDRAMRMDIGKLQYIEKIKEPENYLPDLKSVAKRIDDWMGRHYPTYRKELNDHMQHELEKISHVKNPIEENDL